MTNLRKIMAVILAITMIMSLAVSVSATGGDYSITVTNATAGETYKAYQIFDAVADLTTNPATYSYTIDSDNQFCSAIFAASTDQSSSLYGYLKLTAIAGTNTTYLVEYDSTKGGTGGNDTLFGEALKSVISPLIASATADGVDVASGSPTATATISGLEAGYYYVTTTVGSMVSLGNTPESGYTASIADKNDSPYVEKTVYDDEAHTSDNQNPADVDSDAAIGDTVYFQTKLDNAEKQTRLILHDTMSVGLTFDSDSVEVSLYYKKDASASSFTEETLDPDDDYVLTYVGGTGAPTDGCTFEINFANLIASTDYSSYVDAYILVTYEAEVNENAVIYDVGANTNTTKVSYGESAVSEEDNTDTYVYKFNLYKYTSGTTSGTELTAATGLADAQFMLYNSNYSQVAKFTISGNTYTLSGWIDASEVGTFNSAKETIVITSVEDAALNIKGLDAETQYYLKETVAPTGYNLLTDYIGIYIVGSDDSQNVQGTVFNDSNKNTSSSYLVTANSLNVTAVAVENNSGAGLPETGGIGTTIFYVVGGILVVGAVVLLITKKRLGNKED